MTKHVPTIIALVMLAGMLSLMSNCQVNTKVPLSYDSPLESKEHLDENGQTMKKRIVYYELQRKKQDP